MSDHWNKNTSARENAKDQNEKQTEFLNLVLESLSHPFYVIDVETYAITFMGQGITG